MSKAGPWGARHAQICADLNDPAVSRAVDAYSAHAARECATARLLRRHLALGGTTRAIGARLDSALAILWSTRTQSSTASVRARALPALKTLARDTLSERDFGSLTTLQRGATGTVEVVRCRFDRRLYVLKSILKGAARREPYRLSPVFESAVLASGSDPQHTPQLLAAFQSPGSVHLVLEYFPAGDLDALLQSAAQASDEYQGKSRAGGLLAEDWVVRYAVDIVAAVAWVHQLGFVHRDIKPSNFLLHRTGRLKLCDFSTCAPFSTFVHGGEKRRYVLAYYTQRPAGTCDYIAPEILRCEERRIAQECPSPVSAQSFGAHSLHAQPDTEAPGGYGPAADWWSVGVVLYEMVFGQLPFWAPRPAAVYTRIANHERYFSMNPSVKCSAKLRALIAALVCAEGVRLGLRSSDQVFQHAVFAHVDWNALDKLKVPFEPTLESPTTSQGDSQLSVLHSPMPNTDSFSELHTPPSFSTFGALDAFPGYNDSLDDYLMSPPAPSSWPSSPNPPTPGQLSGSSSGMSTSIMSPGDTSQAWADVDVHFYGFSELPAVSTFAPEGPSSPGPLASTPLTKPSRTVPLPPLLSTPERSAAILARRTLAPPRTHVTPHVPMAGTPAMGMATANLSGTPASPYPFPVAPGTFNGPRSRLRSPMPSINPHMLSRQRMHAMGSDSRHSGGSTRKRDLSECEAWAEMMEAVQCSARNIEPGTPEKNVVRHASDSMLDARAAAPKAPQQAPPSAPRHTSPSPSAPRSINEISFSSPSSSSSLSDGSPEKVVMHHNLDRRWHHASDPEERPALRPRRSTRQLLLDAQVTSTPTRSMRSVSFAASPEKHSPTSSPKESPGNGSRLRRTRRLGMLRASASVRDLREMRTAEPGMLPTLVDMSPRAANATAKREPRSDEIMPTHTPPAPFMDSRRMLSEYRRGVPQLSKAIGDPEDAFGRRTSLVPRLLSGERVARRMQSSLGLSGSYRYGGARLPPDEPVLTRLAREHDGLRDQVSSLEDELRSLQLRVKGGGNNP
ncbi:hypothetical protein MCUN1_000189 [Malassezia cuniculi]|uniref:Protein kinase domain-containing protein n=1 Tax=Malassezia cuniculi TaxID=948313 RepID=A0AAF0J9J6_9BASI|nr:hypothetical protein MCUN1_000189 [Malassezia cuniculi]